MSKIDKKQHKKVIKIRYEKFLKIFETSQEKLCKLLGIKNNINHKFNLEKTSKNLYKYKNYLTKEEINYINKNLSKFI